jgi:hypothetical protein
VSMIALMAGASPAPSGTPKGGSRSSADGFGASLVEVVEASGSETTAPAPAPTTATRLSACRRALEKRRP